jgi:putative membrane protein
MPNQQDLAFVQQATAAGVTEVTEGQIAIAKSLNPAVRSFGQRMVTDHTTANNQLSAIAAQEHIQQPTVLPAHEQQDIVTLELLSDPDFTRTYVTMQVNDHAQTLMQFVHEAGTGQDPALVTFARNQIPVLIQHLNDAVRLDLAVHGFPSDQTTAHAVLSNLFGLRLSSGSAAAVGTVQPAQIMAGLASHS